MLRAANGQLCAGRVEENRQGEGFSASQRTARGLWGRRSSESKRRDTASSHSKSSLRWVASLAKSPKVCSMRVQCVFNACSMCPVPKGIACKQLNPALSLIGRLRTRPLERMSSCESSARKRRLLIGWWRCGSFGGKGRGPPPPRTPWSLGGGRWRPGWAPSRPGRSAPRGRTCPHAGSSSLNTALSLSLSLSLSLPLGRPRVREYAQEDERL